MLASRVGSCGVKLAALSKARFTWSRKLAPTDNGDSPVVVGGGGIGRVIASVGASRQGMVCGA
jgi:hypothetical protein